MIHGNSESVVRGKAGATGMTPNLECPDPQIPISNRGSESGTPLSQTCPREARTSPKRRGRGDALLRSLPPDQRAQVDHWLFEERLPYPIVAERCHAQFKLKINPSSVGRYSRREQAGHRPRQPARAGLCFADPGAGYEALLAAMNQAALEAAKHLELESDPKSVADYARVLIAARNEANHSLRATTTREKYEFDAAAACLVHQVKLKSIAEDESLDDGQRIAKVREQLFGPELPQ